MRPVLYNPVFLVKLAVAKSKTFGNKPKVEDYIRLVSARVEFKLGKKDFLAAFHNQLKIAKAHQKSGDSDNAYKTRIRAFNTLLDHMTEVSSKNVGEMPYLLICSNQILQELSRKGITFKPEDILSIRGRLVSIELNVREKRTFFGEDSYMVNLLANLSLITSAIGYRV